MAYSSTCTDELSSTRDHCSRSRSFSVGICSIAYDRRIFRSPISLVYWWILSMLRVYGCLSLSVSYILLSIVVECI